MGKFDHVTCMTTHGACSVAYGAFFKSKVVATLVCSVLCS
jgi:hypothetical protein